MKNRNFLNFVWVFFLLYPAMSFASDYPPEREFPIDEASVSYLDSEVNDMEESLDAQRVTDEMQKQEEGESSHPVKESFQSVRRQISVEESGTPQLFSLPALPEEKFAFFVKIERQKPTGKIVSTYILQDLFNKHYFVTYAYDDLAYMNGKKVYLRGKNFYLKKEDLDLFKKLAREQLQVLDAGKGLQDFSIVAVKIKSASMLNEQWNKLGSGSGYFSFFEVDTENNNLNEYTVTENPGDEVCQVIEPCTMIPIVGTEQLVVEPLHRNLDRYARLLHFYSPKNTKHVSCFLLRSQLYCSSNSKEAELIPRAGQIKSLLRKMLESGKFSKKNFSISFAYSEISNDIRANGKVWKSVGSWETTSEPYVQYVQDLVVLLQFIVFNMDSLDTDKRDFISHFIEDRDIVVIAPNNLGLKKDGNEGDIHSELLLTAWAYNQNYNQEFYIGNAYRACLYCLSNLEYLKKKATDAGLDNFNYRCRGFHEKAYSPYRFVLLDSDGLFRARGLPQVGSLEEKSLPQVGSSEEKGHPGLLALPVASIKTSNLLSAVYDSVAMRSSTPCSSASFLSVEGSNSPVVLSIEPSKIFGIKGSLPLLQEAHERDQFDVVDNSLAIVLYEKLAIAGTSEDYTPPRFDTTPSFEVMSEEKTFIVLGYYLIKKYLQHEHTFKKLGSQGLDLNGKDKDSFSNKFYHVGLYFGANTFGLLTLGLDKYSALSQASVESLAYGVTIFTPDLISNYQLESYASYIKPTIVLAIPLVLNRVGTFLLGANPFNNWIGTTVLTTNAVRAAHIVPESVQKILDTAVPTSHLIYSLHALSSKRGAHKMPAGSFRAKWFVAVNALCSVADLTALWFY